MGFSEKAQFADVPGAVKAVAAHLQGALARCAGKVRCWADADPYGLRCVCVCVCIHVCVFAHLCMQFMRSFVRACIMHMMCGVCMCVHMYKRVRVSEQDVSDIICLRPDQMLWASWQSLSPVCCGGQPPVQ